MELQRLSVEAFRSLYEVTLAPSQFTVVVGANNAGKSNLGEAFEFLAEAHRHGLEIAVNRKGGFENIAHRKMRRTKRPMVFDTEVSFDVDDLPSVKRELTRLRRQRARSKTGKGGDVTGRVHIHHRFEIEAVGQAIRADFAVRYESLVVTATQGTDDPVVGRVQRDAKGRLQFDTPELEPESIMRTVFRGLSQEYSDPLIGSLEPTDLVTGSLALFNPVVREFGRRLESINIYRLTPLECRKPGAPTPNPELELHGGNLPAVIDFMQRQVPAAWERTLTAMRAIVPGLSDIRTGFTHDRRLTLQFVEEGVGRPWTAEEISDGTIQSLARFAAVFDPRNPISFIEEPENAVHPWIVRGFVDACRSVDYKQVLITTHSPALIGYVSPDELLVVWRRDGRSHVSPMSELDPEALALWSAGKVSTFDLVDSGWLREAVPEAYA